MNHYHNNDFSLPLGHEKFSQANNLGLQAETAGNSMKAKGIRKSRLTKKKAIIRWMCQWRACFGEPMKIGRSYYGWF